MDRQPLLSGNIKTFIGRMRREIREMGERPVLQNDWQGKGHTPDYSRIQKKLERLLTAGHADDVVALGQELLNSGIRQVEESHDATDIQMGVADCMPVIVRALDQSSMGPAARLALAVDALINDEYRLCDAFAEYLHRHHPKPAWNALADQLLTQLNSSKPVRRADNVRQIFARDRLTDWAILALERAGRNEEIIPLCEAEAKVTDNYDRLVARLMAAGRYEDAERLIREGICSTKVRWPGIAAGLRDRLREIRARQMNWPAVTALQIEAFVHHPSRNGFVECKKAANRINCWDKVRACLLKYLERGVLPWDQKGWPLPETGLDKAEGARKDVFPMVNELIHIAIVERNPEQALSWYDRLPRKGFGWYGINEEEIAAAVQTDCPDRAVAIWKKRAEELIAQVTPSAYRDAAKYLRKAEALIAPEHKLKQWDRYLQELRERHARKTRLMEILDGLEGRHIPQKVPRQPANLNTCRQVVDVRGGITHRK
jgi:uncharacterized Zn finger protein